MKLKTAIFTLLLISMISLNVAAQNSAVTHKINVDVPEVALLGLVAESSKEISVNTIAPNEAGSAVNFSLKNKDRIWVNYSSIISKSTQKRKIVAMVQGEIPAGIALNVQASEYAGEGKGKLGKSAGVVTLSNQPTDVIVDIGSCFTGKGVNNGHYLIYQLEPKASAVDYAQLSQSQIAVNVVYTLTDYN